MAIKWLEYQEATTELPQCTDKFYHIQCMEFTLSCAGSFYTGMFYYIFFCLKFAVPKLANLLKLRTISPKDALYITTADSGYAL